MSVPYAVNPKNSLGRKNSEYPDFDLYRDCFEKDRERILHSHAFKRLEHKTQVFAASSKGDHYRSRLTHSLEAANIARIVARKLALCEDLAECIALAHDLGHAPFGHAGERALNACMEGHGGFCHNDFALKLVTKLEQTCPLFEGLNLSFEVLEGIAKHNGPIYSFEEAKSTIFNYAKQVDLDLAIYPTAEAQVASISDDIAYNSHDLEDGVKSGSFSLDELRKIEFFGQEIDKITSKFPSILPNILLHEIVRSFSKLLVEDLIENSSTLLHGSGLQSVEEVRQLGRSIIAFSPKVQSLQDEVRSLLRANFYNHRTVIAASFKAQKIVQGLFAVYDSQPSALPREWYKRLEQEDQKVVIAEYIAGMTDRYATSEYKLFYSSDV